MSSIFTSNDQDLSKMFNQIRQARERLISSDQFYTVDEPFSLHWSCEPSMDVEHPDPVSK